MLQGKKKEKKTPNSHHLSPAERLGAPAFASILSLSQKIPVRLPVRIHPIAQSKKYRSPLAGHAVLVANIM